MTLPRLAAGAIATLAVAGNLVAQPAPAPPHAPVLDPDLRALLIAADKGDVDELLALLDRGIDVNTTDPNGLTAIQLVGHSGSVEATRLLIEAGADVNAPDITGTTALHWAARLGTPESAQALIDAGADVNAVSRVFNTPLIQSIERRNLDLASTLIEAGADIHASAGITPLEVASRIGHAESVTLLLEAGADVRRCRDPALHFVRDLDVAKLLLEAGADVNARSANGDTALHLDNVAAFGAEYTDPNHRHRFWRPDSPTVLQLILAGADVNARNNKGETPIHRAIENHDPRIVQLLISAGADVDAADNAGNTPLARARVAGETYVRLLNTAGAFIEGLPPVFDAVQHGDADRLAEVLAQGADVNARGPKGDTPVHVAAKLNRPDLINILARAGALVSTKNHMGMVRPMYYAEDAETAAALVRAGAVVDVQTMNSAALAGRVEVMRVLIDNGAPIDRPGPYIMTPLTSAIMYGQVEVVRLLLDQGAATTAVAPDATPLVMTASERIQSGQFKTRLSPEARLEITRLLLEHDADPNAMCHVEGMHGLTVLHTAAHAGRTAIAEMLINAGAEVCAPGAGRKSSGLTPLHFAARQGHTDTAALLINRGADINAITDEQCRWPNMTPLDLARTDAMRTLLTTRGAKHAADRPHQPD